MALYFLNYFSFCLPLVPEAVTKFEVTERGSNHFIVEWKPPEESNGILDGYVIEFEEGTHYKIRMLQSA